MAAFPGANELIWPIYWYNIITWLFRRNCVYIFTSIHVVYMMISIEIQPIGTCLSKLSAAYHSGGIIGVIPRNVNGFNI